MNAMLTGLGTYLVIVAPTVVVAAAVHPSTRVNSLVWWALGTATALLILVASRWQRLTQSTGMHRPDAVRDPGQWDHLTAPDPLQQSGGEPQ